MPKSIAELEASKVRRVRFPPNNEARYFMDHSFWKGLPSDRDFYDCGPLRGNGWHDLCAIGYGVKEDYGNGSIFISPDQFPTT